MSSKCGDLCKPESYEVFTMISFEGKACVIASTEEYKYKKDNEVQRFFDMLTVSEAKESWRLYEFKLHTRCPIVYSLDIPLEYQEDMYLKRAKIRNPLGKFKHGRLDNSELFGPETFTHINCMLDTMYNNKPDTDMNKIISNFHYWLKKGGIVTTHIYEKLDNIDPSPREFSMGYEDKDKNKHALTYFDDFIYKYYKFILDRTFSYPFL